MKVIKRYANRRLYDSETSRTINLEDLADFLRDGHDVKVIDNISGKDITSKVLGQTFLKVNENASDENQQVLNYALTALIRESEKGFVPLVRKLLFAGIGVANLNRGERENLFNSILHSNSKKEESYDSPGINDLAEKGQQEADRLWLNVQNMVQDLSHNVQTSIKDAVGNLDRDKRLENLLQQLKTITSQNGDSAVNSSESKPEKKVYRRKSAKAESSAEHE